MSIAQSLLPEFDHEMATTRTLLACVPPAHGGWKPHARSMSLGELTAHLANLPSWGLMTLQQFELDMSAPESTPPQFESLAATLARFDLLVANNRNLLIASPDAVLLVPWTLKRAGHALFSMPRIGAFRLFVLNHMVHHRGQWSVYLRLLDVPVPPVYGPTADTPL
jgi:uncharacterized damage-inducible protein DinB